MQQINPFQTAQRQLDIVKPYMDINEGLLETLKHTKRDLIVHFPVKMDDGTLKVFTGYRVVHNPALGPTKGGIRYHPDVNRFFVPVSSHTQFPFCLKAPKKYNENNTQN